MSPRSNTLSQLFSRPVSRARRIAWPERGAAPVIALHAGDTAALLEFATLAHWLCDRLPEAQIICTTRRPEDGTLIAARLPQGCVCISPLDDELKFHAKLKPDVWVWSDPIAPKQRFLGAEVIRLHTPLPSASGLFRRSGSGRERTRFDHLFCPNPETRHALSKLDLRHCKLHDGQGLGLSLPPTPHNPEREQILRQHLGDRPVWHAAHISDGEIRLVAEAQSAAARSLHRLLLLVSGPSATKNLPDRAELWRADPTASTTACDMLVATSPEDAALFYRCAPMSFIGHSTGAARGASPLQAIALGSAVLHGPSVADFSDLYRLLDDAQAALEVPSAAKLQKALTQTMTPDRIAEFAHNGWQVTSEGAETLDAVMTLISARLEGRAP